MHIVSQSTLPQAAADYPNTLGRAVHRGDVGRQVGPCIDRRVPGSRAHKRSSSKARRVREKQLLTYANESGLIVTSGAPGRCPGISVSRSCFSFKPNSPAHRRTVIVKESIYVRENVQGAPGDGGNVIDSGPMASYQIKLADLRRELADATTSLTESHPKVQRLLRRSRRSRQRRQKSGATS